MAVNDHLAFGIDISRYQYLPDGSKKMDFEAVAKHKDPFVSFVVCRAGISWGYQDPWFKRNWDEIGKIGDYRDGDPAGRGAYHVIYPGEDPIAQVDNLFRIIGDGADWDHDRLVIDAELDHGQSEETITNAIRRFAYVCHTRTGRYPILYTRTQWLYAYTAWNDLAFMDMWLAQYRYPLPYPLYTPEYQCPPVLGYGENQNNPRVVKEWLIHQTTDRGKSIGGASYFMDYNRWNGKHEDVMKYFGMYEHEEPEPDPEPEPEELTLESLGLRVDRLEEAVF
jgi:GH25 family lysozyme M1 (1,4-beta-N-acetylmuramidase)